MLRLLGSHHCSISNVNCDLRAWKWLFLSVDYLVCSLGRFLDHYFFLRTVMCASLSWTYLYKAWRWPLHKVETCNLTATSIRIKDCCAQRTCVHLISIHQPCYHVVAYCGLWDFLQISTSLSESSRILWCGTKLHCETNTCGAYFCIM